MFKAKELKVNGELGYYVGKGNQYFPKLKYPTLKEAQEEAIIRNLYANYDRAKKCFAKLEKLMPEKYDENKGFDSDKSNMADLLA